MAGEAPPSPAVVEHLNAIRKVSQRIDALRAELDGLYTERGDLFLAALRVDGDAPTLVTLAAAAGDITPGAVRQQVDKARAREAGR